MPVPELISGKIKKSDFLAHAAEINAKLEKRYLPAVSLSILPGLLDNTYQYNGAPFSQDNLATYNGVQYAVWANDTKKPTIGRRTLPAGKWTTFDLAAIPGNPLFSPTVADGHNTYSLGVDSTGRIHVAGNMHGEVMRIIRSTNPGDITAWTVPGGPASDRNLVSYPRFFSHPDGTLFLHYRNGASVAGDNFLDRWDGTQWVRVAKLVDGLATTESAYDNHIVFDAEGVLHYSFSWKTASTYNDINDIGYMQSADKGVTWRTVEGTAVSLPVTHPTAPTVLDTAPNGSGIANQFGMDVDSQGRPHMATFFYDGANRQINHFWWTGSAWQNDKITDFTQTINDFVHWPSRPSILCTAGDRVYVPYRYQYEGKRGSLRMIDCTPGVTSFVDFPIAEVDLREWEGVYDTRALKDRNELHMLITPLASEVGARPDYWNNDNWTRQWGGVLSIDLAQLAAVEQGVASIPRIRSLGRVGVPSGTSITATSLTPLPSSPSMVTPTELQGRMLLVRLSARASVSAGGTTLTVQVRRVGQGDPAGQRLFGTLQFTGTSTALKVTPWMPVAEVGYAYDALLDLFASAVGGGTGSLSACSLELAVLDSA